MPRCASRSLLPVYTTPLTLLALTQLTRATCIDWRDQQHCPRLRPHQGGQRRWQGGHHRQLPMRELTCVRGCRWCAPEAPANHIATLANPNSLAQWAAWGHAGGAIPCDGSVLPVHHYHGYSITPDQGDWLHHSDWLQVWPIGFGQR
jgi:hypothetical protein